MLVSAVVWVFGLCLYSVFGLNLWAFCWLFGVDAFGHVGLLAIWVLVSMVSWWFSGVR